MTTKPRGVDSDSEGDWASLFEDLLRGLVHAMNNRLTALSAFAELAGMDGEDLELNVLRQEITRMHGACSHVGMLVSRGPAESLEIRPVLDMALEVHSHHPRMRNTIPCAVDQSGAVLPVRVPRWALLRALLLLIDQAKREGQAERLGTVGIRVTGDESTVRVHFAAKGAASHEAARLARLCGGTIEVVGSEQVLQLPSLAETRRRERAGDANPGSTPTPAAGS
jgi:hypothetical protein